MRLLLVLGAALGEPWRWDPQATSARSALALLYLVVRPERPPGRGFPLQEIDQEAHRLGGASGRRPPARGEAEAGQHRLGPGVEVVAAAVLEDLDDVAVAGQQLGHLRIVHRLGHPRFHLPHLHPHLDDLAGRPHVVLANQMMAAAALLEGAINLRGQRVGVAVDAEQNVVLVKGAIPGPPNGLVYIQKREG